MWPQQYIERGMDPNWNDNQPIYRQLRDRMVALILEGALKEGDPLPSVRAVAADYRLNPLTVLKGYQQLVDERLVEKRRRGGMYVSEGARKLLLAGERDRFLHDEWPRILAVIHRLGFSSEELFAQEPAVTHPAPAPRIQARDLSKKFGSQVALDHVSFAVQPGRIVGLIGPNGAGKTTALRAVLGLTTYDGAPEVLGREPFRERAALMSEASFIAD